jgi:hypothetical protein
MPSNDRQTVRTSARGFSAFVSFFLLAACESEPAPTTRDSLVTWSGEELLDTAPLAPPRETTAFQRVYMLPLATDSPRVLATAGQPPDDRFCRGDTLVWFWHRGLEVSFLDGYIVESHLPYPAGFEGHRHIHRPVAEGRCTVAGTRRSR